MVAIAELRKRKLPKAKLKLPAKLAEEKWKRRSAKLLKFARKCKQKPKDRASRMYAGLAKAVLLPLCFHPRLPLIAAAAAVLLLSLLLLLLLLPCRLGISAVAFDSATRRSSSRSRRSG